MTAEGEDEQPVSAGVRRRPRRRRRVEGGRQHRHEVKVTAEEEGRLLALALRYQVSVPKLLVDSTLSGGATNAAGREELLAELFRAHRLLAGIANNVNQIARATNATGEAQAETSATLAAVRRTAERIDGLIDELAEARR